MEAKRIALVGLMGSGKSTIGRALADELGWHFVDMDRAIEERAGKSISDLFRESGEDAFRSMERETLQDQIDTAGPLVLATGGGVPLDPQNRRILHENFVVVWLRVAPEEAARRLEGASDRPLLQGGEPESRLTKLLAERARFYGEVAALALDPAQPATLVRSIARWTHS